MRGDAPAEVARAAAAGDATGEPSAEATDRAPATVFDDLDAALEAARLEQRPLFVHFTASWCLPCRELREQVYPRPEVAEHLAGFVRAEIDVESATGGTAARRYRVQTLPVLVFLDADGTEHQDLRIVGKPTTELLLHHLDASRAQRKPVR